MYQKMLNFFNKNNKQNMQDFNAEIDMVISSDTVQVNRKAYEKLNKNQLVKMLIKRGIEDFNKRDLKATLIDKLMEDDKKKL